MLVALNQLEDTEETNNLFTNSWFPLCGGLMISMIAGILLERFDKSHPALHVLLPVQNGVVGGVVSVAACRMISERKAKARRSEFVTLTGSVLLIMAVYFISTWALKLIKLHALPALMRAALIQTILMLFTCGPVIRYAMHFEWDLITFSLPILTSISDALGGLVLIGSLLLSRS